jgi:hypothetical protein
LAENVRTGRKEVLHLTPYSKYLTTKQCHFLLRKRQVESTIETQTSQDLVADACAKVYLKEGERREDNVEGEGYLQS